MGAGKTTVGRILASHLGWEFEDLDDRIIAREKRTISEIFERSGEQAFRRAEHEALQACLAEWSSRDVPKILALGGGAFVQPENEALLAASSVPTAFLDAPVEELWRRCSQEGCARPLLRDMDRFRALYQLRRPYYLRASLRVETAGKAVETIAVELVRRLHLRPRA